MLVGSYVFYNLSPKSTMRIPNNALFFVSILLFTVVSSGATQAAPRPSLLPDTGQSACYDGSGNAIACPSPGESMAQDGSYSINSPSIADNGDDTISDNNTGLMWQKEDDSTPRNWARARKHCTDLSVAGYVDWRLPNIRELRSIVNYGNYGPAIDAAYFTDTDSSNYWSSTTYAGSKTHAWTVFFSSGHVNVRGKSDNSYVRCVRGSNESDISSSDFSEIGDGTVVHQASGLTWQREDDNTTRSWEDALSYCEGSSLGGHYDWRLPNIAELQTIVDYGSFRPAINQKYFPGTNSSYYWSSATYTRTTSQAWHVYFNYGDVYAFQKSGSLFVRCVRGGL